MGLRSRIPNLRAPSPGPASLDPYVQLAPPAWQPKLKATHQSPRIHRGQPVEAPHLEPFIASWNQFCFLDGEAIREEDGAGRTGGTAKSARQSRRPPAGNPPRRFAFANRQ